MTQETVAVVVAHPDDEVLAFGGIMSRHAERGDRVSVLILATGLFSRGAGDSTDPQALGRLRDDARAAARLLGVSHVLFEDFPDNRMDSVALLDVVKCVERFVNEADATTVYTHHDGDLNIDHTVTSRAVLTACRPLPGSRVRSIYAGEVQSSSEYAQPRDRFVPTTYVGISSHLERKCEAMRCYGGEIREFPHPRSVEGIRALARMRGSEVGLEAAEALRLLRSVER